MLLFVVTVKKVVYSPPGDKEQKISLNLSEFIPPPAPKPVIIPPVPQPIIQKPIKELVKESIVPTPVVKKKLLDEKKRISVEKRESEENNMTKVVPKKETKIVKKKVEKKPKKVVKKKVIKKKIVKRKKLTRKKLRRSKDPLANALMGSGTSMFPTSRPSSSGSYGARMIKKLYGKEFNTFSPNQKKFIKANLGRIHRITQRTLTINGYPDVAVRTKQQGTNIVSFYLHSNGNITGLRLKKRIGYAALDQNTLEVIRIAYKDYPRPKSKTKITFYVKYSIY